MSAEPVEVNKVYFSRQDVEDAVLDAGPLLEEGQVASVEWNSDGSCVIVIRERAKP